MVQALNLPGLPQGHASLSTPHRLHLTHCFTNWGRQGFKCARLALQCRWVVSGRPELGRSQVRHQLHTLWSFRSYHSGAALTKSA